MGRVVALLDHGLPALWVGFYLLLPVSGWAAVMFESWFDQRRDLDAVRSLIETGSAAAIDENLIGPAYIAGAALLHFVFGLSPEDALVALTRASYALSVALGMLLVGTLVRRLTSGGPMVSLGSQVVFGALVFSAGTWHWSDVPWSHFLAACLAVGFYAARLVPARARVAGAVLVGVALGLLALTRTFELVAVLAAWALVALAVPALTRERPALPSVRTVAAGLVAFLGVAAAVHLATGKDGVFVLYGNTLDRQSGDVLAAEVAETPTFSPGLVPVKLVQLFVEPCFYSLCSLSDYAGGVEPLPDRLEGAAGNERLWRLPLLVQLPALALLPLCLLACGGLLVWWARNRTRASAHVGSLRLVLEATVASTGLVLGYAASTMTGSSHLRYGFARVFLLPALLVAVAAAVLVSAAAWHLVARRRPRRLSPELRVAAGLAFAAVAVVALAAFARAYGLPRLDAGRLESVVYRASCTDGVCDVSVEARSPAGREISIPERSTLTFGCGSERARFTLYVEHPSDGVQLGPRCPDARLVAAWPVVMGLPPGSYELRAVRVEVVSGT
ncbi:MAG TPA: hypothetical protein VNJ53_07040 [Gaiellaceae bacterium]|nr:hypothetical protein [Gaiellaceae bacterium]